MEARSSGSAMSFEGMGWDGMGWDGRGAGMEPGPVYTVHEGCIVLLDGSLPSSRLAGRRQTAAGHPSIAVAAQQNASTEEGKSRLCTGGQSAALAISPGGLHLPIALSISPRPHARR